jgi:hypothetical protein
MARAEGIVAESASVRHRYLLGAMQQAQIVATVPHSGTPEEVVRLPDIIRIWRDASARMQELSRSQIGAAENAQTKELPPELTAKLNDIATDPLFQATFSERFPGSKNCSQSPCS